MHGAAMSARLAAARTLLFVPGDRPDRVAKALRSGADAVIVDLEDGVAEARKEEARAALGGAAAAAARGDAHGDPALLVRINGLDTGHAGDDVAVAYRPARPPRARAALLHIRTLCGAICPRSRGL
jgi:citrate lyase subunit beta / citryl-CoA lyase